MVEATHRRSITFLGSEFDDFLFAPIGEETNGKRLSVVSALARLDLDPWQEAANLTRLPQDAAIRRLAMLIAIPPNAPSALLDLPAIATKLIARLHRPVVFALASPQAVGAAAVSNPRVAIFALLVIVMLALGTQFIMARHHAPPAPFPGAADSQTPSEENDLPSVPVGNEVPGTKAP